jgi:hypothetical protein
MRNSIIILLLVTLFGLSCEKNVDIDIEDLDPMIVLNGLLEADSTVEIFVSRTRHILDNKELGILSDAEVSIIDPEGTSQSLSISGGRTYSSSALIIEQGSRYRVTVEAQGFEPVEATVTVPVSIPIDQIDTASSVNEWGEQKVNFEISFTDPPGEENYYMLSLQAKVPVAYFDIIERLDTLYVDEVKDTVIMGIVYDTIEYTVPRYENLWIESEDLAIEQWDYFNNQLIFTDKLFDGKKYSFNGSYYTWFLWDAGDSATIYYQLHSVDEHYFKYVNTREDHYYAKDDPFAVPVVVHNNIENGVGILGASSASVDSMKVAPKNYPWEGDYWY